MSNHSTIGHNEKSYRLDMLFAKITQGLDSAEKNEDAAIADWLEIGAALNEARALHKRDTEFGLWLRSDNLSDRMNDHERAAAMWAAANSEQFEEARATGNARTVRGIHAKWKEIEAERKREAEKAEAAKRQEEAKAARKEAEEKARAEQEAREKVEAASSKEEREEAQAEVAKAAEERQEAEERAQVAEIDAGSSKPEEDPETAKARREIVRMDDGAKADEIIGLRADLADARKALREARSEIKALKESLRLYQHDDKNAVIRALETDKRNLRSQVEKVTQDLLAEKRKTFALNKRVEELESMEFEI